MSSERLFGASTSTTTRTRTVEGGLLCTHAPNSEPRTPNPELRTRTPNGTTQGLPSEPIAVASSSRPFHHPCSRFERFSP